MDQQTHSQQAYRFYESLGSPKYICAPMVDQSELAFRMLCRKYGCTLAYTPMLHSRIITTTKHYMNEFFTTIPQDRPLFAQFCGNDPQTIVKAAKMIEDQCDAIDINLGCPQGIAKRGNYGSFLLEKPEIIMFLLNLYERIIQIKIDDQSSQGKYKDPNNMQNSNPKIEGKNTRISQEDAGCSILCVHGRLKEQNKDRVGECNWSIIKEIKETLSIPVIANGGIYTFGDIERCLIETSVDGVMSAEALLENPALFSGIIYDLDQIALEYMFMAKEYRARGTEIKAHLFKILYTGLQQNTDIRERLSKATEYDEYLNIVLDLKNRRGSIEPENKLGWYLRYQISNKNQQLQNEQLCIQEQTKVVLNIQS